MAVRADVMPALRLAAVLAGSGVIGVAAHRATRRLRGRGWTGSAASWCLSGWAMLLVLALAGRTIPLAWTPGRAGEARAAVLTGWPALGYLAFAVLLFAMFIAHSESRDESIPLLIGLSETAPRGSVLAWGAIGVLGWAVYFLLTLDTQLPIPTNPSESRRVLADASLESRLRPADAHTQFVLGIALVRLERYDEARPVLQRVVRLDPANAWAHTLLGYSFDEQHRFAEAVPHLQEAVRIAPEYGEAQDGLGHALSALGRYAEAEKAFRAAVRLDPKDARLASQYALVLFRRHRSELAMQQALRAVALEPANPQYHVAVAYLLRADDRIGDARAHLGEALRSAPAASVLWGALGVTEYASHDAPAAERAFAQAARLDPAYFSKRPGELEMWRAARRGNTVAMHGGEAEGQVERGPDDRVAQ